MIMKRILVALTMFVTLFSFSSVLADEGEVMGGSHLPPVRTYEKPKPKAKVQKLYYEDNLAMGNNHDPYINSYEKQYPYAYDYQNEPVYYGYYWNGYWYNYTDAWGNPMYLYKGFYYYY